MKKLLLLLCFVPALSYGAFNNEQFQPAKFASVNQTMYMACTNYSSHITPVGAYSVLHENINSENGMDTNIRKSPRRVKDNPGEPYQTPIGDIPILLIILFILVYIKKKENQKFSFI